MIFKKTLQTLTPGSEEIRKAAGDPTRSITGSEIVRAGAILGAKAKVDVVIIEDPAFSTSSYAYEGRAVLINTVSNSIPVSDRLVGTGQINLPSNVFAVLKPNAAKSFLKN